MVSVTAKPDSQVAAKRIVPGMDVLSTDRERVGTVEAFDGQMLTLSGRDLPARRYAHSLPAAWIDWSDANHVYLAKSSGYVFENWLGPKTIRSTVDAPRIKPYMLVFGSDGVRVGMVEKLHGLHDIMLMGADAESGGLRHLIPIEWSEHILIHLHLRKTSDEVFAGWRTLQQRNPLSVPSE